MLTVLHAEPKFSELFVAYLVTRNSRIEHERSESEFHNPMGERRLDWGGLQSASFLMREVLGQS